MKYILNLFSRIGMLFQSESEMSYKLNDMSRFLDSEDLSSPSENTAVGSRVARYPLLFKAFLNNPFFGYYASDHPNNIAQGNHLYWMSRLTIFGIFGFLFYASIHFQIIKSNLKFFNKEFSFYYLLSIISVILLGLMKNLAGKELWFSYITILPGLYYLPLLKK